MAVSTGQVRPKQLKLNSQYDIIIADMNGNGTVLSAGSANQVLRMDGQGARTYAGPGYGNIVAQSVTLTQGKVLIGDSNDDAAETSLSQGQVVLGDSNGLAAPGTLAAQYVSFATKTAGTTDRANASNNVQQVLQDVANSSAYRFSVMQSTQATVLPTMNQEAGYRIGDVAVNDVNWVFVFTSEDGSHNATWTRVDQGVNSNIFTFKGSLNATTDALPSSPSIGDYYSISTTGSFTGSTHLSVLAGDGVVFDGTNWEKIDNTDSTVAGIAHRVTVTGNSDIGFTVDIASDYAGQASINTLGTITTGTWNGTIIDAAHGGLGMGTFAIGDLLVADSTTTLRRQAIGAVNKVLTSNGTTVEYDYVSVLRDASTGVAFTQVKQDGSGHDLLAAVTATVSSDDPLVYTTLGYVSGLFKQSDSIYFEETFTIDSPSVTVGSHSIDVLTTYSPTDSYVTECFINGWKLELGEYANNGGNDFTVYTTQAGVGIGYALDSEDEIMFTYKYNPNDQ